MSNKCKFCGEVLTNTKYCTSCGTPNPNYTPPKEVTNDGYSDESISSEQYSDSNQYDSGHYTDGIFIGSQYDSGSTVSAQTGETQPYYAPDTNTSDSFSFASGGRPSTIEELKAWAQAKNLPLADMRFFIGENYLQPRAFGIYEDNGNFIVYKNKSDGSRAVRYSGVDEAYAVGELYDKMCDEIRKRKGSAGNRNSGINEHSGSSYSPGSYGNSPAPGSGNKKNPGKILVIIIVAILAIDFIFPSLISGFFRGLGEWADSKHASNGYYYYNDDYYYYQDGGWYEYDDRDNEWESFTPGNDFLDNYKDYYYGYNYSNDYGVQNFSDSSYYQEPTYDDNDNYDNDTYDDYDYTWDNNDTWDAGGTDWDSDW